ncbi:hypothetical protein Acr_28g0005680 [Actinidia rufa]|uniref:Uncharacterized protein n=1 Tax=Actinidia rufa TaxID=165716 RepID=A0A7J0H9S4_9ERIC|nr:hypothetical protein Acr_28g0005680 [Actinidia rufa]
MASRAIMVVEATGKSKGSILSYQERQEKGEQNYWRMLRRRLWASSGKRPGVSGEDSIDAAIRRMQAKVKEMRQVLMANNLKNAYPQRPYLSSKVTSGYSCSRNFLLGQLKSFLQFSELFVAQFIIKTKAPKVVSSLLTLCKGKNVMLRNYSKRYWELYNEIKGCSEELAVINYKLRLTPREKFYDDLALNPPIDLRNLMSQVEMEEADNALEEDLPIGTIHMIGDPHDPKLEKGSEGDPQCQTNERAKQCYLITMSTKVAKKEVQLVEEERKILEDASRTSEDKVIKDLIRYELDELSLNYYYLVGSNMKQRERIELIEFLKGIEVNSEQIVAINDLESPRNAKEVQKLTRMVTKLNRFITIKGQVLADFVAEFSPQTMSPKLGYLASPHREEESSAGTSIVAEVTTEGPEVLKEPPQIEIMPTARTPPKVPEVLKEPP